MFVILKLGYSFTWRIVYENFCKPLPTRCSNRKGQALMKIWLLSVVVKVKDFDCCLIHRYGASGIGFYFGNFIETTASSTVWKSYIVNYCSEISLELICSIVFQVTMVEVETSFISTISCENSLVCGLTTTNQVNSCVYRCLCI